MKKERDSSAGSPSNNANESSGRSVRRNEDYYRTLIENVQDVVMVMNADGTIRSVNPSIERLFGYKPEEIIGTSLYDYVHPEDLKIAATTTAEVFQSPGGAAAASSRIRRKDGSWLYMEGIGKVVKDGDEEPYVIINGRDATERHRSESALRDSEERYRMVFESSPEIIAMMDLDGKVLSINPAAESLTGYAKSEIVGRMFFDLPILNPAEITDYKENFRRHISGESTDVIELQITDRHGGKRWVETHASVLKKDGAPQAMQVIVRDITERVKAEQALRESEQKYRALAELAQDMIFIINRNGIVEYVNEYGARQVGMRPEEMIGKSRDVFFHGDISERQRANLARVFTSGETVTVEHNTPFKGKPLWLDTQLVPIRDKNGEVRAVLGISRDATERKRLEQAKTNFLSSVSHELRTPLTLILGFSELLLKEPLSSAVKNKLRIIHERGRQELKLVEELIALATFESGKPAFEMRDVRLWDFLRRYAEESRLTLANLIEKRHHTDAFAWDIRMADGTRDAVVFCDVERLKQALDNLLENAVKYSSSERLEFRITADMRGKDFVIGLWDRGHGVPESEREMIFRPFYQIRKGQHPLTDGMGQGLSIVKEYVEAQGGNVWSEGRDDGGSVFFISLPSKPTCEERSSAAVRSVLVVDDDEDMATLVEDLLQNEGFEVHKALDRKEMMQRLEENQIDMILLDVHLPECNGTEILGELKRSERHAGAMVYLFSAKTDDELSAMCIEHGADGYVSKPFEINTFLERIGHYRQH